MVQMLCYLLEVLLTPENTPPDCPKELYELYFVFASIWAFGGAMFQDQVGDSLLVPADTQAIPGRTAVFPSHQETAVVPSVLSGSELLTPTQQSQGGQ